MGQPRRLCRSPGPGRGSGLRDSRLCARPFEVDQGAAADCYFVAALGEVAQRTPDAISQMFIDNGDGTWTVRFFNNGAAAYVTVDKFFPADGNGRFVYDNHDQLVNNGSNK